MYKNERVGRYSLILETQDGNKYYYDVDLGTFVMMYEKSKPKKTQLEKLDFLTANYASREQFANCYRIDSPIKSLYITYQFKGERRLAPVFNNEKWAELAKSYTGKEVDFRDNNNFQVFNTIYFEIADLNSDFADKIIKNANRLITISPQTKDVIVCLRAHERAIEERRKYSFGVKDYYTEISISDIYSEDRSGFYRDLQKRLSDYRELRTIYLNYCRIEERKQKELQEKQGVTAELGSSSMKLSKKPIVPPQQLSMFDKLD